MPQVDRLVIDKDQVYRHLPLVDDEGKLDCLQSDDGALLGVRRANIDACCGKINLFSSVSKVVIEHNKVTGIEVGEKFQAFDIVVSTTPLSHVNRLIPDFLLDVAAKFSALKNIAVVCLIVKLKKAVTDHFWLNINDKNMEIS
jgi:protoporphyrinogen oxidase